MSDRWTTPTADDLKAGPIRTAVEETLESWAPNYVSESGHVSSYEEWVERVDGLHLEDGSRLDLGATKAAGSTYARVRAIARSIAADLS